MSEGAISPINLRPQDIAELKEREATISREQRVLEALRRDFINFVEEQYGVDLKNEDWTMDLEAGTLVKEA